MKKLYLLIPLILTTAILYVARNYILPHIFHISGEITITDAISSNNFKRNNMLFIIAKNEKQVPLAVKGIINPVFPLKFKLSKEDLILQDLITVDLIVECVLNKSGKLGKMNSGDIYSSTPVRTSLFSKDIKLTLDSVYK